jgi:hypothetical protein
VTTDGFGVTPYLAKVVDGLIMGDRLMTKKNDARTRYRKLTSPRANAFRLLTEQWPDRLARERCCFQHRSDSRTDFSEVTISDKDSNDRSRSIERNGTLGRCAGANRRMGSSVGGCLREHDH